VDDVDVLDPDAAIPGAVFRTASARGLERRPLLTRLVDRIELSQTSIAISIDMIAVRTAFLDGSAAPSSDTSRDETRTRGNGELVTLTIPTQLKRAGVEMRFIVDGADGAARAAPDTSLHRLLA
jgi:hypothetical protein